MAQPKFFITRRWPAEVDSPLEASFEFVVNSDVGALTCRQLQEALQHCNAVLPRPGSATEKTRIAMGMRVVDNVRAFSESRPLPDRFV